MSTTSASLTVRGIDVEIIYKDIKNLHIGVYPPHGRVRVAAPLRFATEQVRLAVIQRLPWIRRHQRELVDAARQTAREMVTGESHYVWGNRLRLKVAERPGRALVLIEASRLHLLVPSGSTVEQRHLALQSWYRTELHQRLEGFIAQWEPIIGREVPFWSIRKMKTRWGSCNPESGRLWFNLELAKKHPRCVEYVVVHEMVHLIERRHDDRFITLMDGFMPDWRSRRDELNAAPLAHEDWAY